MSAATGSQAFSSAATAAMKRIYQGGTRAATRERIDALRLNFKAGESVLDLGCNQGEFCTLLKQAGARATGVDRRPPKGPGFLRLDLNQGLAAAFASVGIERFDHVLALSVWKYIDTPTIVDLISYYARKSATIEFNPGIKISRRRLQKLFKRSGLVVSEMWETSDRFERLAVRLINQQAASPQPPHIVQNKKTGTATWHDAGQLVTLDAIRNGALKIASGTVVMMRREELLKLRGRRWKPLTSWWCDEQAGRPLTGREKMAWLARSCQDGWDWRRPAHVALHQSANKLKLVNGSHRLQVFQGELVPTLLSYFP